MGLTPAEKAKLAEAVYGFLASSGHHSAAEAYALEADLDKAKLDSKIKEIEGILQKKWTSVLRLSRKVYELEREKQHLKQELEDDQKDPHFKQKSEGLPVYPQKFTLKGHMKPVNQVLFHPLYSLLLSASDDGSIKIWDYEEGTLQNTLRGHTNHVTDLSFDKEGKLLASSSKDLKVRVWNTDKWDCAKVLTGHDHMVNSVRFVGPQCDFLVSCSSDKTVRLWEVSSGHCKRIFKGVHDQAIMKAVPNDSGQLLASCGRDEIVCIWSMKTIASTQADSGSESEVLQILKEHSHAIQTVAFANQHARLTIVQSEFYEGPGRQELKQEEPQDSSGGQSSSGLAVEAPEEEKKQLKHEDVKGDRLAQIKKQIEEKKREKREAKLAAEKGPSGQVTPVRFLPEFLASGGRDCNIVLWEVATGRNIKTFEGHQDWVTEVFFHANGKYLLSSSDDHTIRIWDLKRGRCFKRFEAHNHFVTSVSMSHQGQANLATGSVDHTIKVWGCR